MTAKKKEPDPEQVFEGDPPPSVIFHALTRHLERQDAVLAEILKRLGDRAGRAVPRKGRSKS